MNKKTFFCEEFEEDMYSKKEAKTLLEDDEIVLREEAFTIGYDEEINKTTDNLMCRFCRREIDIEDNFCPACGSNASDGSAA